MQDAATFVGQLVDGQFPLQRYLGGGVRSAVFLTEYDGAPAAIKFVPVNAVRLTCWEAAAHLSHAHLVRIFAGGEHRLGPNDCAYVVTEYADDNLASLLAESHLTPVDAREMVGAIAGALAFLHANAWVHGRVAASNIMGVGERVTLSSDSISPETEGAAAADCLALGLLLRQGIPSLPAPLLEIVQHATDPNPATRWTAAMIVNRIGSEEGQLPPRAEHAALPSKRPAWLLKWLFEWRFAAAGAAALAIAGLVWYSHGSRPAKSAPPPKPPAATVQGATAPDGTVKQVLPEIPRAALDTITGRVRINVRVSVDPAGTVTGVVLETPQASKYFSDRVLTAARQWRFRPARAARDWELRFQLTPRDTTVSAARVSDSGH